MRMIIGSKIALIETPPAMLATMRKALSLHNPAYGQALKRNPHARIFLSPKIPYYTEKDGVFFCGRGLEDRIHAYAEKHEIDLEFYERTVKPTFRAKSTIALRPYQEGVPERAIIAGEHGILRLDTGWGKTFCALRMAELLETTALFIVPKKSILGQFVADIEKFFGMKAGIIGDGKFDVQPFTVATIQTLQKKIKTMHPDDAKKLSEYYGAVFVDECHTTVPKKSRQVVEFFASRHVYGLTATNRRTDEQGEALDFMYGKVLVDGKMERATPSVEIASFAGKIPMGEYHDIIEDQINDYERNKLIASRVVEETRRGRRVLVLTKRVSHYDGLLHDIRELDPEGADRAIALRGTGSSKERAAALADLRSGGRDFSVLLGTFSLLSTGVDVPSLDTLVIAGDLKSDVLTEQSAGRILRLFEGKQDPLVVDVNDVGNPILKRQAQARRAFYIQQGWKINK